MTTLEIIFQLINEGHEVEYTKRKDGGVRIKRIDSQKFSGSKGNTRARAMTGKPLSERRIAQLNKSYMRTPKGRWGNPKNKKEPLPEEAKKLIRQAQRVFRKSGTIAGTSSTRRFRENMEMFGYEEAMRRLKQNIRYAKGLAYEENVDHLINLLRTEYLPKLQFRTSKEGGEFLRLIEKLEAKKTKFKDKWIKAIREKLYQLKNSEISVDNLIADIYEILRE